ncbi:MAG: IS5 family transposase [Oleiphilaceae bacterium]
MEKGKDHKPYEYGRKASVLSTLNSNIIVGVASHDLHEHDSKTLKASLSHAERSRQTPIQTAVADRGYRVSKRSATEPIISHLKHDYRLCRNWLEGSQGNVINLLMATCAWNLRK